MKKSAKILSIILALVMILSVIPMAAFAADDEFVFNGSTITSYKGAGGDIVIPDTLNGKPVTGIGDWVFERNDSITSVVIPDSVTSIGRQAFYLCSNLKNLTIGSGLISIGDEAFIYCPNLENITVAPDNTVYDSRNDCNALIETETNTLRLGAANTVIPDTVTAIATQAFFYRTSLEGSMVIPEGVTKIGYQAFRSCINLEGITIPSSVTTIGSEAFITCWNLESIVVDPDNTVYDSRDNCNAIIETASNRLIVGCKNTVIPDSVVSIASSAFFNSKGLESITLTDKITVGYEAFYGCENLKTVYYPCDNNLSTIKGNMSSYGTLTYTPIHDIVSYTDNEDGTHTGECACGSTMTEKEDHTFVDGVCTFCGAEEPEIHIHMFDMAWTTNATAHWHACIMGGCNITDYSTEKYSYYGLHEFENGKCKVCDYECEHPNKYTVPAKEVTCTENGNSEYLYCPDCEQPLEIVDVYVALNHINAYTVTGKAATCAEDGLTDGEYCPDCEKWIVEQETIPALNHKNAYNENGEAETCTSSGYTPGVYCPDCETYISGHETIEPHPHPLADKYIDNEDGTHSQHCTECGEPIITKEHTFVDGVCVCGAKKPITIGEIIATVPDFPTTIEDGWTNENGGKLFINNNNSIEFSKDSFTTCCGLMETVIKTGDNYIISFYEIVKMTFIMEDDVLVAVILGEPSSTTFGTDGTYKPHTHAYTDSYVDNGDGTHTGSCSCGAVNPEKEAHTFVDGVCVCGAKEAVELEIISITEKSDAKVGELIDLEILVSKPVKKVAFIDANGNTTTFGTTSTNTVSVVNNDDGTQTWTVKLTVRHSVDEYTVKVKERSSGSWSDNTYDLKIEGEKPAPADEIISVEFPDAENGEIKYGAHDVVITTGKDVSRVQVAYAGTTATYSKSNSKVTVEADGDTLVWTISFNFYKVGSVDYTFASRASSGSWKTSDITETIDTYKTTPASEELLK